MKLLLFRFKENKKLSCFIKMWYWIIYRLYRMMVLSYFIRNTLQMSQFAMISSIYEIYKNNTTNSYRIISFIFSILTVLIYMLMTSFILYLIFSSYKLNENDHNKLEEFFRGLKLDKRHRLYIVFLLLRRIISIILLVVLVSISSQIIIVILVLIQAVYFIYLLWARPYNKIKENLIEIINEIYFTFLLIFLSIINTENEWNDFKISLYMWIMFSNTLLSFIIVTCKL